MFSNIYPLVDTSHSSIFIWKFCWGNWLLHIYIIELNMWWSLLNFTVLPFIHVNLVCDILILSNCWCNLAKDFSLRCIQKICKQNEEGSLCRFKENSLFICLLAEEQFRKMDQTKAESFTFAASPGIASVNCFNGLMRMQTSNQDLVEVCVLILYNYSTCRNKKITEINQICFDFPEDSFPFIIVSD